MVSHVIFAGKHLHLILAVITPLETPLPANKVACLLESNVGIDSPDAVLGESVTFDPELEV